MSMDPSTIGSSALTMQAGGAINSTIGSYFSAQGQKASWNNQAQLAKINAQLSEDSAQSALLAGQKEEQQVDMNTTNLKATQRASFGANGIDMSGGGSPIAVLNTTDTMGQIDADQVKANAVRQAWGYRVQATNESNQALTDTATAKSINPGMVAEGSLLTGASQVASSWYSMNRQGVFSGSSGSSGSSGAPDGENANGYSKGGYTFGPYKDNGSY